MTWRTGWWGWWEVGEVGEVGEGGEVGEVQWWHCSQITITSAAPAAACALSATGRP